MKYRISFLTLIAMTFVVTTSEAQQTIDPIVRPAYRAYYAAPQVGERADDDQVEDLDDLNEAQDESSKTRDSRSSFGSWPNKSILETNYDIRETNNASPEDRSYELLSGPNATDWHPSVGSSKVFAWAAPDIRYQPLYFEDVPLERYGQTAGLHRQPWHSGVHFFKAFVFWPNQMRHDHPYSCDSPLGFCRPGQCVPATKQLQYLGYETHQ